MEFTLIFIPRRLQKCYDSAQLLGVFTKGFNRTCDSFYVLEVSTGSDSDQNEAIGLFNSLLPMTSYGPNCIYVSTVCGVVTVDKVYKSGNECPKSSCHIIEYDMARLIKSEFYIDGEDIELENISNEGNYFKVLGYHLRNRAAKTFPSSRSPPLVVRSIISLLSWICFVLEECKLSIYSSIGLHLMDFCLNVKWIVENVFQERRISLQTGNSIVSFITDIGGGLFVAYMLERYIGNDQKLVLGLVAAKTEGVLEFIKSMIKWLMGSPAGLKLNYPLNYILGNFFLYNIYLWWTFLGLIRPLLEIGFNAFLKLRYFGIALQVAILADIFSLVTFHLYCIYIYAARLYEFQIRGIISLSKIFLGRKRNPEPDKVDSCPYSTEQLFVGTVCFTVLLFLLPTTLVYYVVFTLIRLGFIFFGGILTQARFLLQILPLYSSIVWFACPQLTMSTTRIIPKCGLTNAGVVTLIAKSEVNSWFETTRLCLPSNLRKPKSIEWKIIVKSVLSGKLIYPV